MIKCKIELEENLLSIYERKHYENLRSIYKRKYY